MKYALVTGGSGGIGGAICLKLASMGYHVMIHYNTNMDGAKSVLQAIKEQGGTGDLLQFDVTDKTAVDNALKGWKENHPESYIAV